MEHRPRAVQSRHHSGRWSFCVEKWVRKLKVVLTEDVDSGEISGLI